LPYSAKSSFHPIFRLRPHHLVRFPLVVSVWIASFSSVTSKLMRNLSAMVPNLQYHIFVRVQINKNLPSQGHIFNFVIALDTSLNLCLAWSASGPFEKDGVFCDISVVVEEFQSLSHLCLVAKFGLPSNMTRQNVLLPLHEVHPYTLSLLSRPNITGAIRDTIASNGTENRFHWIVDSAGAVILWL